MSRKMPSIKPRKTPVQSRSSHTVDIIFEATIQVLLALGPEKFTTTKVAERAGVSVGTLYQYFGDKRGLLHGALERHLLSVTKAVEQACNAQRGQPSEQAVKALVHAFIAAKFAHADASRALYLVAPDVECQRMVTSVLQRGQKAICDLLVNVPDIQIADPITMSLILATAMAGPVQALLELNAPPAYRESVQQHLVWLVLGYLRESAPHLQG